MFTLPDALQTYGTDAAVAVDLTRAGYSVSSHQVARWRRGRAFPRPDALPHLIRLLGCTAGDLGDAALAYAKVTASP